MAEKKESKEESPEKEKKGEFLQDHPKHKFFPSGPTAEERLAGLLLPNEVIVYHANDLYLTDRRIIKRHGGWPKILAYFYSTFEDLDYRFLEGIKAKNVLNIKLLAIGIGVFLLGPIFQLIAAIPGIGQLGTFLIENIVAPLGAGGLFLIGIILIAASLLLRDRIVEFYGEGTLIRSVHFSDEELRKVRELQAARLKRLGMEK